MRAIGKKNVLYYCFRNVFVKREKEENDYITI